MNFTVSSDSIVFEIDQAGVHLRKAPPIDKAFSEALQGTLSEWESAADDEAYADLWKIFCGSWLCLSRSGIKMQAKGDWHYFLKRDAACNPVTQVLKAIEVFKYFGRGFKPRPVSYEKHEKYPY